MIGQIIYVHRRLTVSKALNMIYEHSNESGKDNFEKQLRKQIPEAFSVANISIGTAFIKIEDMYPSKLNKKKFHNTLLKSAKRNLDYKKFLIFSLAFIFGYRHYGVEVNAFDIVHFTGSTSNLGKDAKIVKTSRKEFLVDGELSVDYIIKPKFSPEEIASRAISMIGTDFNGYDAFDNNCEHFTTWCATDTLDSRQAIWWNEKVPAIQSIYERFSDYLWSSLGQQARSLKEKADADEKYSDELIEILAKKRVVFESRLEEKTNKFRSDFFQLDQRISSCLANQDYDGVQEYLHGLEQLLEGDFKHKKFEEFTQKMLSDDEQIVI